MFAHLFFLLFLADIRGCICDPSRPDTMQARECALTSAAAQADSPVLFVKDANPTKPNRWLAIPHALQHTLADMTPPERARFWNAAIEKARATWGGDWGIAINSEARRSQCQLHAHIGKLLDTADRSGGTLVDRVEDIPVPGPDLGIWIHPEGTRLRVHLDQAAPEPFLLR